jgi:hypothetical protein
MRKGLKAYCECGIDIDKFPHYTRICSRYLSGRLKNYAAYLKRKFPSGNSTLLNLSVEKQEYIHSYVRSTPFTTHVPGTHCVLCSCNIFNFISARDYIRIGEFCGIRCADCGNKNLTLCPMSMKEARVHCVQPTVWLVAMLLKRHRIPRDVRTNILRRYLFPDPNVCLHNL